MRCAALLALLLSLGVIAGGCGGPDDSTPVACLNGPDAYFGALGDAPGEVRLGGEVAISECLAENQSGGDLATVGAAMVAAATRLNAEARAEPGGEANVRLGYLIGAAERGEERSEGIHADLLRRLEAAALYSPGDRPLSPAFQQSYRRGYEAGSARG